MRRIAKCYCAPFSSLPNLPFSLSTPACNIRPDESVRVREGDDHVLSKVRIAKL